MNGFRQWLDRSLGRRIGVLVSVLLLLFGSALSLVSYYQVRQLARKGAESRLHLVSRQLADLLARGPTGAVTSLNKVAADSGFAAALSDAKHLDTGKLARVLSHLAVPSQTAFQLLDSTGARVLTVGTAGQPVWMGPRVSGAPDSPPIGPFQQLSDTVLYYDVQIPVPGPAGMILVQRSRLQLSPDGSKALNSLVGPGKILVGSRSTGVWTDLASVVPAPPPEAIHSDTVSSFSQGDEIQLGMAQGLSGVPWMVLVSTPQAVIDAPAQAYLRRAILVALLALALGTVAAAVLGHRLSGPIREITEVTERLAAGDAGSRANEASSGEIGRLARSFNAMLERVVHSSHRLRDSETSLRAFVSHSSLGIWHLEFEPSLATDVAPEYQIDQWYRRTPMVECNPALARMLGAEPVAELIDLPLEQLFPREDARSQSLLRDFIAQGFLASNVESQGVESSESTRIYVNDLIGLVEGGRLRRIWGTRRDVTMERMLDDRLAQAQRLEAIGRLAGGVAHDFNNLLTVILANSELLLERMPAGSSDNAGVEEIRQTALRAAQLTRQLLLFSRGQVARPDVLNLNTVATSVEAMLRRVIGEDIQLTLRLAPALSPVRADPGQIEQVLMNLVVNARDAMPNGGSLELRTGEVVIDDEYVRLRPTIQTGRYVMLAVTDSGAGMSAEVQKHAFEPFFTTKAKGRGTGLGLATVYGIVRQSGGDVVIYSELDRGTTIKVFLPARAGETTPVGTEARPVTASAAGSETILVIEDEPALRDMVRRALMASGYHVLEAGDGAAALQIADERTHMVDLVLTDMILPGMTGRELTAEFRRRRPGLPIIIMSGYTGETYPALEALPVGVGYLEKPFSLADLRQRVREALDQPPR